MAKNTYFKPAISIKNIGTLYPMSTFFTMEIINLHLMLFSVCESYIQYRVFLLLPKSVTLTQQHFWQVHVSVVL
jgi:hypothetical protein